MEIEGHQYGHLRSDPLPHRLDQRTIGVLMAVRHRGTVQMQQDAVDPVAALGAGQHHGDQFLPAGSGNRAGRGRRRIERVMEDPAEFLCGFERGAEGGTCALQMSGNAIAREETTRAKAGHVGADFAEGVGLMHDLRDQNVFGHGGSLKRRALLARGLHHTRAGSGPLRLFRGSGFPPGKSCRATSRRQGTDRAGPRATRMLD
jgi:hypothetical protein